MGQLLFHALVDMVAALRNLAIYASTAKQENALLDINAMLSYFISDENH